MSNNIRRAFYCRDNNLRTTKIPHEFLFTKNSNYNRDNLKRRIIAEELISYICAICHAEPYWKNKQLVLVLDHINGINNDNRLENLRFLCPNCNSQTETFAKNIRYRKPVLCEDVNEIDISYEKTLQPFIFDD